MAFAFYAVAQTNKPIKTDYGQIGYFDLQKTTLFNTPGIPNQVDWEAFEKREANKKAALKNPKNNYGFDPCSCVSYVRYITGINTGTIVYAKNHPVNSKIPTKGAIVVFYGGVAGHLALVLEVYPDGSFLVTESNFIRCTVGQRVITNFSNIKGYYIQ